MVSNQLSSTGQNNGLSSALTHCLRASQPKWTHCPPDCSSGWEWARGAAHPGLAFRRWSPPAWKTRTWGFWSMNRRKGVRRAEWKWRAVCHGVSITPRFLSSGKMQRLCLFVSFYSVFPGCGTRHAFLSQNCLIQQITGNSPQETTNLPISKAFPILLFLNHKTKK